MKNRIVVAFLVALALAVCGPPLVAAPSAPLQPPVKVYTAPSFPVPSIITGDLAITFPGLEEAAATAIESVAVLGQQQKATERLLLFVLLFSSIPVAFIFTLLISEFISRRKAAPPARVSRPGTSRSRQPPSTKAKRTKRAAAKPKAPAAAPVEGS